MLPDSITKPVSDLTIRANKYHAQLKRKLSPSKRRRAIHRIRQAQAFQIVALDRFMAWGTSNHVRQNNKPDPTLNYAQTAIA